MVRIRSCRLHQGRTFLSKRNGSCPQLAAGREGPSFSNRVPSPCSVVVQHSLEILRQGANDGLNVQTHALQCFLLHREVLAPGAYLQRGRGEKRGFSNSFQVPLSALSKLHVVSLVRGTRQQTGTCHLSLREMKRVRTWNPFLHKHSSVATVPFATPPNQGASTKFSKQHA